MFTRHYNSPWNTDGNQYLLTEQRRKMTLVKNKKQILELNKYIAQSQEVEEVAIKYFFWF
jgi:hypothetical protein